MNEQLTFSLGVMNLQATLQIYWSQMMQTAKYQDGRRLTRYGHKVYSQCDEDGIIQEIFRRIGVSHKLFVEIGVGDGKECNTAALAAGGWMGRWFEANEGNAVAARTLFPKDQVSVIWETVTQENINSLLFNSVRDSPEIDLLSIDIDYNDFWVWRALNSVSPRVVVIEYNAALHPPLSLVVPYEPKRTWDGRTNFYGASLSALWKLGNEKGYRLVGCSFSGANAFFVRDDLIHGDDRFLLLSPEGHYEPPRYFMANAFSGQQPLPGPYVTV
jgi:hypothetical protein